MLNATMSKQNEVNYPELNEQMINMKRDYDNVITQLQSKLDNSNESIQALEIQILQKTDAYSLMEANFSELNEQMIKAKSKHENLISELQSKIDSQINDKSLYESKLEQYNSQNLELNQKLSETMNQTEILQQIELKLNEEVKSLHIRLDESNMTIDSLTHAKDDLNRRLAELHDFNSKLETDLSNKSEVSVFFKRILLNLK